MRNFLIGMGIAAVLFTVHCGGETSRTVDANGAATATQAATTAASQGALSDDPKCCESSRECPSGFTCGQAGTTCLSQGSAGQCRPLN